MAEMITHCRDKLFHSSANFAHAHFNFQIDSNSIAFSCELKFLAANIFDDARISPLLKTARIELWLYLSLHILLIGLFTYFYILLKASLSNETMRCISTFDI